MGGMLIQCQDVWKSYGSRPALHGLNLQLESGKRSEERRVGKECRL